MLDTMLKVSLTLVAFDKMSRVIRDAVNKSNDEFDKLQLLQGADLHINWESQKLFLKHSKWNTD